MKLVVVILGAVLLAGGCARRQQQASLPPPPKAAPPPTPAPPPKRTEPLSIPQTDVRLPAPQPVPEEALATIRTPPRSAAPAEPELPKPPRKVGPTPPPNVKLEPEPEPEAPPPTAEPRIQALLSPEDRSRMTREIAARRREIEKIIAQLPPSTEPQRSAAVERVVSFLTLSDQAAERGELRQANEYSNRALVLAKELVSAP